MTAPNRTQRYESLFRAWTPIFLIGVSFLALLGPWLPGAEWIAKNVGPNAVLGFCTFLLGLYTLLLWGESLRLHAMMGAVLKELLDFKNRRAAEVQARPLDQKLDAARMLIPALSSQDPKVSASAHRNLQLLLGQDLGTDPTAWTRHIEQMSTKG